MNLGFLSARSQTSFDLPTSTGHRRGRPRQLQESEQPQMVAASGARLGDSLPVGELRERSREGSRVLDVIGERRRMSHLLPAICQTAPRLQPRYARTNQKHLAGAQSRLRPCSFDPPMNGVRRAAERGAR
jgi:hypothetical protein